MRRISEFAGPSHEMFGIFGIFEYLCRNSRGFVRISRFHQFGIFEKFEIFVEIPGNTVLREIRMSSFLSTRRANCVAAYGDAARPRKRFWFFIAIVAAI